jgi:hypothetical protein
MQISPEQKRIILEQYSQDSNLDLIDNLSEEKKSELLFVLWWKEMLKKKDKLNLSAEIIKHLCQTKLQTILFLEKENSNPIEKIDTTDYKNQYYLHKDSHINTLSIWQQSWEVLSSKHVFEHTISDLAKYKSWSLIEKIKYERWLFPNFSAKYRQQKNYIDKKYLSLDPEKVDLSVVDFLKTGEINKKKYNPNEELLLKKRLLDNHNYCKEILFWYEPLVLPKDQWYSQETTERIVKLKKEDKTLWYLVSENIPIRYTQDYLRKYRWNKISFEIFSDKESLIRYLGNQLFFIKKQRERFQETILYFTSLDTKAENKEDIKHAYIWFSTHGTFTDQFITQKLEQLISGENRGRKQIIDSIINQVREGIKESELKEAVMLEHYNTVLSNNFF